MMQYFQRKPPAYCAVQFNGVSSLEGIGEMLGTRAYTMTSNDSGDLVLQLSAVAPNDTDLTVVKGNFIVRNPDGSLQVVGHAEFRNQFQVLA